MADTTFRAGDKVSHITGGPQMAVESIGDGPQGEIHCSWFSPCGEFGWEGPSRGAFPAVVLKPSCGDEQEENPYG